MKFRTLTIIASAVIAVAILALPATESNARMRYGTTVRSRANLPKKAFGQFNVSGRYTGLLNGWVDISGEEILVTAATRFFFTDEGLMRGAPMLVGQAVYVSGITRRDGTSVATFVIVQSR